MSTIFRQFLERSVDYSIFSLPKIAISIKTYAKCHPLRKMDDKWMVREEQKYNIIHMIRDLCVNAFEYVAVAMIMQMIRRKAHTIKTKYLHNFIPTKFRWSESRLLTRKFVHLMYDASIDAKSFRELWMIKNIDFLVVKWNKNESGPNKHVIVLLPNGILQMCSQYS